MGEKESLKSALSSTSLLSPSEPPIMKTVRPAAFSHCRTCPASCSLESSFPRMHSATTQSVLLTCLRMACPSFWMSFWLRAGEELVLSGSSGTSTMSYLP